MVLQSVWYSKEGIAIDNFFNSNSLFMGPVRDEKIGFTWANGSVNFNIDSSQSKLLYLPNHILMLCYNRFHFALRWQTCTRKIMISVIQNNIVISPLNDFIPRFQNDCY